jgi:hypothetical protein
MTLLSNTTQEKATCPTCEAKIQADELLSPAALRDTVKVPLPAHLRATFLSENEMEGASTSSSKIEELLQVGSIGLPRNHGLCTKRFER